MLSSNKENNVNIKILNTKLKNFIINLLKNIIMKLKK